MSSALLIVDVQRGMFEFPDNQPHDGAAAVARMRGLLDRARGSGVKVFFVQHDGGEGDVLAANSKGFPFVPELTPHPSEDVTVKRENDAFEGTDLAEKLRHDGIDHLVVCGMQTEWCINATVRGAATRGFAVTLVSDAHTTYDTPEASAERIVTQHNDELASLAAVTPAVQVAL